MSVSDVLFEAEKTIVFHLRNYSEGDTKQKVERLLEEMDAVRCSPGFDTPPFRETPPKRTAHEIVELFQSLQSLGGAETTA